MKIYLRDKNREVVEAWKKHINFDNVFISQGNIFDIKADAIVSPANSYGRMNGGIDYYYREFFGIEIEQRLQESICQKHNGELPVGESIILPTYNEYYPYLISAPTMRVPQDVSHTQNAYLAFKSVLKNVLEFNKISSFISPGLGTLTGKISPDNCAKQMNRAISEVYGVL